MLTAIPEVRITVFGFPMSLAWEIIQSPSYTDTFEKPWGEVLYNRLHCSVGDVMILLAAFWVVAVIWRRSWISGSATLPVATFVAIGVTYTMLSEYYNVSVAQNWAYSEWVPTIGDIGLVPVFQWLLVPSLIIRVVRSSNSRNKIG